MEKIYKLVEYRESAEPDYPTIKVDTFSSIFKEMFPGRKPGKIGLAGYQIFPLPVYDALRKAVPDADISKTDIISDLRTIKSQIELEMLQESFRISEAAIEKIIGLMTPGNDRT